jgi:hypothetical protein
LGDVPSAELNDPSDLLSAVVPQALSIALEVSPPLYSRRVVMNVSRIVSLVAAIVISSFQWSAFFNPALHAQSEPSAGTAVAADSSEGSLPLVVVTAHHQPWMML